MTLGSKVTGIVQTSFGRPRLLRLILGRTGHTFHARGDIGFYMGTTRIRDHKSTNKESRRNKVLEFLCERGFDLDTTHIAAKGLFNHENDIYYILLTLGPGADVIVWRHMGPLHTPPSPSLWKYRGMKH